MKKLPIGIESFSKIIQNNYYYADKTSLIRDLISSGSEVTLFTRPRRFGKSLNMDMLKTFFTTSTNPSLFNGLSISKDIELCKNYQGKFPVISISLKDVDGFVPEDFFDGLKIIISESISLFKKTLLQSSHLDNDEKETARRIAANKFQSMQELTSSLKIMSRLLYEHYGRKTIILIDEYDVPLDKAYQYGFYEEIIKFIRLFLSSTLKTNNYLEFAVLTGCLQISRESIFTGLNNFKVMSVSDNEFSKYFGFTSDEVKDILKYYGIENKYSLFKEWYDGYKFGNTEIYCPWDVINQCMQFISDSNAKMKSYWINTSSNSIVKNILNSASQDTREQIEHLISEESIKINITTEMVYTDLDNADKSKKENYLWSILYSTGYLTDITKPDGTNHTLAIPNKEIMEIYKAQVLSWININEGYGRQNMELFIAIEHGDISGMENLLNNIMSRCISIRDTNTRKEMKENFYHGIIIGLLSVNEKWIVKSEQESGIGYPDILVKIPEKMTGCVFEIKYAENGQFDKACKEAMKQIKDKKYKTVLEEYGMKTVYLFGIAFYKKNCKIIYKQENL